MASIYSDVVPVVEVALSCKLPSYGIISSDGSLENEVGFWNYTFFLALFAFVDKDETNEWSVESYKFFSLSFYASPVTIRNIS